VRIVGTSGQRRGVVWTGPRLASVALLAVVAPFGLSGQAAFASDAPATSTGPAPAAAAPLKVSDASSQWQTGSWGDVLADLLSFNTSTGGYDATRDPGSLYTLTKSIGARSVWNQVDSHGRHITGQGVTVALLDSGAEPVSGLNGAGKLVYGPDLSLEASDPSLTDQDDFGHGTHLAGIIGAHDAGVTVNSAADPSAQLGVAPDATIMPIKLATADGATDVSQVIAALDWVVQHRNDDPAKPVRVVNLSFGTDSLQNYQQDPLAAAAENAWRHGIVVVVSGGNEGTVARLTDPAIDPYVIAVGASDPQERTDNLALQAADFSSVGSVSRHADLLAPGTSIASLRDTGSYIDTNHPEGQVLADTTGRLFRGSGTSQAAAVVSGSVALLLQDHPELTPDQVKGLLMANADKVKGNALAVGSGELDIAATINSLDGLITPLLGKLLGQPVPGTRLVQSYPVATGLGSLDAARGGSYVYDPDSGTPLTGEQDVQGMPWNAASWSRASANASAWQGGSWLGTVWSGTGWTTSAGVKSWVNAPWTGARWSGARWSGARWSDAAWTGARWSGARWSDSDWTGARWSGARWSGARWSDAVWGAEV
jgi:serine protease AprX